MPASDVNRTIDAVWRIESARLIAGLARIVRDVGVAEDLAQEALVAALEQWPESGVPDNPGAWLMATAKHRAIDRLRRAEVHERKTLELEREIELQRRDRGRPISRPRSTTRSTTISCASCSRPAIPVLSTDARVALTLRLLGGLTTKEIARAYLVSEATVAQRIVRAKRTLSEARVPFEVPERDELGGRLASVLEVIYLIFNEGYAATAGDDWIRPELIEEALRLGRILAELLPAEPEVHGLVALMELHASRSRARIGPSGEAVLLLDQDRVALGLAARRPRARGARARAEHAAARSARTRCRRRSPPATRAPGSPRTPTGSASSRSTTRSPSSCPRRSSSSTAPSRSGWRSAPRRGSSWSTRSPAEPALRGYHLLPTVRGDLLAKLGRRDEARRGVRARRVAHPEHARARSAARAHGRLLAPQRRPLSPDPPMFRGCLGAVGRARVDRPRIHVVNHLGRGRSALAKGHGGEAPRVSVDPG